LISINKWPLKNKFNKSVPKTYAYLSLKCTIFIWTFWLF
jgi:hypothetical protein